MWREVVLFTFFGENFFSSILVLRRCHDLLEVVELLANAGEMYVGFCAYRAVGDCVHIHRPVDAPETEHVTASLHYWLVTKLQAHRAVELLA